MMPKYYISLELFNQPMQVLVFVFLGFEVLRIAVGYKQTHTSKSTIGWGLCFFNFTIDWVCDTIYTINLCYTTLDFLQLDCFLICVM